MGFESLIDAAKISECLKSPDFKSQARHLQTIQNINKYFLRRLSLSISKAKSLKQTLSPTTNRAQKETYTSGVVL